MYEYPILMHNLKVSAVSTYTTVGFSNGIVFYWNVNSAEQQWQQNLWVKWFLKTISRVGLNSYINTFWKNDKKYILTKIINIVQVITKKHYYNTNLKENVSIQFNEEFII